ncbi:hypothetical protein [Peptoniphilus raoultii]|uniref:hypothetical protein n=1 Tax=Peptoniphilus raoultii TaxID=1776387 RepID=UPI0008D98629|nr:hypothetical protein [Peptoniphilus raoultii]
MIYQEALKAMKKRIPVKAGGIVYKRINAIIFRKTDTREYIQLELQDKKTQNSITIVNINQAEAKDET